MCVCVSSRRTYDYDQDSNLRGQSPVAFEATALTARPDGLRVRRETHTPTHVVILAGRIELPTFRVLSGRYNQLNQASII